MCFGCVSSQTWLQLDNEPIGLACADEHCGWKERRENRAVKICLCTEVLLDTVLGSRLLYGKAFCSLSKIPPPPKLCHKHLSYALFMCFKTHSGLQTGRRMPFRMHDFLVFLLYLWLLHRLHLELGASDSASSAPG